MRIALVSTSPGAGKTTLGRKLAKVHVAPFIELDSLFWGPGWIPREDFKDRVELAIHQPAWVIDGNYAGALGKTVTSSADLVVWLDLPIWLCFLRVVKRTLGRVTNKTELWGGNRETLANSFWSKDSLLWWVISTSARCRRLMPERLSGRNYVRLRSQREVDAWLAAQPAEVMPGAS